MYLGLTKALTYYMDLMNKDFMEFINDILSYSKDEK
jgi:hypothetical protein